MPIFILLVSAGVLFDGAFSLWVSLSEKREVGTKTPDTYYINNDYTNATKVYEDYIKFKTGSKHKSAERQKTDSQQIDRNYRLVYTRIE